MNHEKPKQWSTCHTIPVLKSGNLNDVNNYRGISLTTIAQKITNKHICNHSQPFINLILRNSQNGFRPGRSTTTHILED